LSDENQQLVTALLLFLQLYKQALLCFLHVFLIGEAGNELREWLQLLLLNQLKLQRKSEDFGQHLTMANLQNKVNKMSKRRVEVNANVQSLG
jgi:hypothetical protein